MANVVLDVERVVSPSLFSFVFESASRYHEEQWCSVGYTSISVFSFELLFFGFVLIRFLYKKKKKELILSATIAIVFFPLIPREMWCSFLPTVLSFFIGSFECFWVPSLLLLSGCLSSGEYLYTFKTMCFVLFHSILYTFSPLFFIYFHVFLSFSTSLSFFYFSSNPVSLF